MTVPRSDGPPRVAYVAYAFPVVTQTFTVREVAALRRQGLALDVFSAKAPAGDALDAEAAAERARTHYLPPPFSLRSAASALAFAARRPLRTLSTFVACLGGGYRDEALRCRLRAPLHFLVGASLARELARRSGYFRVHAQFLDAGSTVAFVAARLLDLRFSIANHTAYNPYLLRVKSVHADLLVSISEFDRTLLLRQAEGAADPGRCVVSRVGVLLGEWTGVPRRPEPRRVLSVGALREKKGHRDLLLAAARLAERGAPIRVVLVGAGPEEGRLRAVAAERRVDVEFLGAAGPDAVRAELARAEAFVLACRVAANGDLDGIPVALMEAMAAGVPVVSTRLSGIPELVEDGVSGLLAAPGDDASLADAIGRLLDDAALRGRLADAARTRVTALHDLSVTSVRLAGLLAKGAA